MDIFLYVVIGLAAVVLLLVLAVAFRSPEFAVVRSTTVAAPPDAIFPEVNDLHRWAAWSPFEKLDPNVVKTFDGPPAGVGASYHWKGNAKAGEGRMTVTDSRPSDRVQMKLDFVKPFRCSNAVEFTFVPDGGSTRVTWRMTGRHVFPARVFGLLVSIDKMVGRDFEKRLAALKAIAEEKGGRTAAA